MNIMRWVGRGLLLTVTTVSIALWITVMTLQSTLLNRSAVLGWLDNSGAYNHVLSSVINLQNVGQDSGTFDQETLQKAIGKTLPPSYIKQVSETGINAVFDWLEGKSDTIAFSIPVADKRTELQQQLQNVIAPQLKNLPVCKSNLSGLASKEIDCLPAGSSPEQAATTAAKQAVGGSEFLTKPINQEVINSTGLQTISWLPMLDQSLGLLSWLLPLVALLCGVGYIFIGSSHLRNLRSLAGHLLFSSGITTAAGLALWYFGSNIQLDQASSEASQSALLSDVIQPIIHQVVPAIGISLMLFAGSMAFVAGATWVTLLILGKRMGQNTSLSQPVALPKTDELAANPIPPLTSHKPAHSIAQARPTQPPKTLIKM